MEDILKQILEKVTSLDSRMENLESQVKENTQILKSLEHKVDVVKSEQENTKHEVAKLSGKIENMQNSLLAVEDITAKNWSDIVALKRNRI